MSDQRPDITIETTLYAIMHEVLEEIADGAGLGILRGPAGIGKSYAVAQVTRALEAQGVTVIVLTATPAIGGSLPAFVRAALDPYRIATPSTPEAVESLYGLLAGYPFRTYGPKVLFIVDEAQELKTVILETLRALWDRGDAARFGAAEKPSFGLAMVGNDTFMGRDGGLNTAHFRPLKSRVTHNIMLPRPNAAEQAQLSRSLFPQSEDLQAIVCSFGEDNVSFRAQANAARQAKLIAQRKGEEVSEVHLRRALRMMGAK